MKLEIHAFLKQTRLSEKEGTYLTVLKTLSPLSAAFED